MATQADVAQALQAQGVSVFGLKVNDQGGVTNVSGTVQSADDKQKAEKAIASLGTTVRGNFELQVPVGQTGASSSGGERRYTVKAGDTLSKIAKEMYGDASKWHAIHQANRDLIPNPDLIHPGQNLVIPAQG